MQLQGLEKFIGVNITATLFYLEDIVSATRVSKHRLGSKKPTPSDRPVFVFPSGNPLLERGSLRLYTKMALTQHGNL